MKKFILTGVIFFIFGVLATIGVFIAVNFFSSTTNFEEIKNSLGANFNNPLASENDQQAVDSANETFLISEEGFPLRNLSLDSTQKKALETVGINTETFIVTKSMLECARIKVGSERVDAFISGSTPSLVEIGKLLPCLK